MTSLCQFYWITDPKASQSYPAFKHLYSTLGYISRRIYGILCSHICAYYMTWSAADNIHTLYTWWRAAAAYITLRSVQQHRWWQSLPPANFKVILAASISHMYCRLWRIRVELDQPWIIGTSFSDLFISLYFDYSVNISLIKGFMLLSKFYFHFKLESNKNKNGEFNKFILFLNYFWSITIIIFNFITH